MKLSEYGSARRRSGGDERIGKESEGPQVGERRFPPHRDVVHQIRRRIGVLVAGHHRPSDLFQIPQLSSEKQASGHGGGHYPAAG